MNVREVPPAASSEQALLLCNLLDLLRSSAESTEQLVDDFDSAGGFQFIVNCCLKGLAGKKNLNLIKSVLD